MHNTVVATAVGPLEAPHRRKRRAQSVDIVAAEETDEAGAQEPLWEEGRAGWVIAWMKHARIAASKLSPTLSLALQPPVHPEGGRRANDQSSFDDHEGDAQLQHERSFCRHSILEK